MHDTQPTISILTEHYALNWTLVRMMEIGHKVAGCYDNRSRATYWDGTNKFDEKFVCRI